MKKAVAVILCMLLMLTACLPAQATVILDAGHGAPDGGSVGFSGTLEKDIDLALAMWLAEWCRFLGVPFGMTRTDDNAIYDKSADTIREKKISDLHNRLALAQKAEQPIYLSIHMNASPLKSAHGLQVFFAPSPGSEALAEALTRSFRDLLTDVRVKPAVAAPTEVYLMRQLACPAVILEYGFITNPAEEQRLLKRTYQYQLAFLTLCGTLSYLQASDG